MNDSLAGLLASQNLPQLQRIVNEELTDEEITALQYDWAFWGRVKQLPPRQEWLIWAIITGRGWGKTRTGAETVRSKIERNQVGRVALVGATTADVRDVMIDGDSGLLATCPPWFKPEYIPSKRRLTWPNGARAYAYTAEEPDRLRGPQHGFAWCDEIAAWRYGTLTWDNLMFGLRQDPGKVVITTTPRPVKLVKDLVKDPRVTITSGATHENLSNLSATYKSVTIDKYEGTRLGRQELMGELLLDNPGALWSYSLLEAQRVDSAPELKTIVVAVDPATTNTEASDETGIIVAGLGWCKCKGAPAIHGFVLADYSVRAQPTEWADTALRAYRVHEANGIVGETNNGGDLIEAVLRTRPGGANVPFKKVVASRGKLVRAEPIASQYERGLWHHVGLFADLEDQQTSYTQGDKKSPDRMDALVWAAEALMPSNSPTRATGRAVVHTPVQIGPDY